MHEHEKKVREFATYAVNTFQAKGVEDPAALKVAMDNLDLAMKQTSPARTPIHIGGGNLLVLEHILTPAKTEMVLYSADVVMRRDPDIWHLRWNRNQCKGRIRELFIDNPGTGLKWIDREGALVCWGVCHNVDRDADKLRAALVEEMRTMLSYRLQGLAGLWCPTFSV